MSMYSLCTNFSEYVLLVCTLVSMYTLIYHYWILKLSSLLYHFFLKKFHFSKTFSQFPEENISILVIPEISMAKNILKPCFLPWDLTGKRSEVILIRNLSHCILKLSKLLKCLRRWSYKNVCQIGYMKKWVILLFLVWASSNFYKPIAVL